MQGLINISCPKEEQIKICFFSISFLQSFLIYNPFNGLIFQLLLISTYYIITLTQIMQ